MWMEVGVSRAWVGCFVLAMATGCKPAPAFTSTKAPATSPSSPEPPAPKPETLRAIGDGPHGEPGLPMVVSRTPTRVHVLLPSMKQEWLFLRDAKDPARVQGFWILHRRKAIVKYTPRALRIEGIAQDWDSLLSEEKLQVQSRMSGVFEDRLQDADARFPDYQVWTLPAWRKAKHQTLGGHHHGGVRHSHEGPADHGHR